MSQKEPSKQPESCDPLVILGDAAELEFREIAAFNGGTIGVFRSGAGVSPWELHPDEDELLYVLAGAVTITLLNELGTTEVRVKKGAMIIVPRGTWHRHIIDESLVELYVSPALTRHSIADDPRIGA